MVYMFILWLSVTVGFDRIKIKNWLLQLIVVYAIALTAIGGIDMTIRHCGFPEENNLIFVTMITGIDSSDYFKESNEHGKNKLKYYIGDREYKIPYSNSELFFYPMENEIQRIEKYETVYKSKLMNILVPKITQETYYKIYYHNDLKEQ